MDYKKAEIKLSISNIAWSQAQDEKVYKWMKKYGLTGLEIAPTRIIPEKPYEEIKEAVRFRRVLEEIHGFCIPSMQSIWYGRQEKLFGSEEERRILMDYTRQAIDFASAMGCRNLVFGCPANRARPEDCPETLADSFFRELGEYAYEKGVAIGMEANPPIYNTNYINDTASALELVRRIDSRGFRLNLDIGTMIQNGEDAQLIRGNVALISHVHLSEPRLMPIAKRPLHREVLRCLKEEGYQGFLSIEMGKQEELSLLEETMAYVKEMME